MILPKQRRQQIRELRRSLSTLEREQAAQSLAKRVAALKVFYTAHRIAGYLAFDGEMDPAPLLERALNMGKQVYLPVLVGKNHLMFGAYSLGDALQPNRFGILEPDVPVADLLPPQQLDLVLTPLVAFDTNGTRMGMGAGFYDRSFAFLHNPAHLPRPRLLGLAYEVQKIAELVRQPWDVPLDGIATEENFYPGGNGHLLD
jgi:5-formyltetrahydrofolate cyclo-ligase